MPGTLLSVQNIKVVNVQTLPSRNSQEWMRANCDIVVSCAVSFHKVELAETCTLACYVVSNE